MCSQSRALFTAMTSKGVMQENPPLARLLKDLIVYFFSSFDIELRKLGFSIIGMNPKLFFAILGEKSFLVIISRGISSLVQQEGRKSFLKLIHLDKMDFGYLFSFLNRENNIWVKNGNKWAWA